MSRFTAKFKQNIAVSTDTTIWAYGFPRHFSMPLVNLGRDCRGMPSDYRWRWLISSCLRNFVDLPSKWLKLNRFWNFGGRNMQRVILADVIDSSVRTIKPFPLSQRALSIIVRSFALIHNNFNSMWNTIFLILDLLVLILSISNLTTGPLSDKHHFLHDHSQHYNHVF